MPTEKSSLLFSDETQGDVETVFNILKIIMGAGGFAFPWAFAHMGIATGLIAVFGVVVLGCLTLYDLKALKTHAEGKLGKQHVTYAEVARMSIGYSGSAFVYAMTVFASLLACAAYLAYIAETLNTLWPALNRNLIVLATASTILPITWLEDFSWLSRLAICGTLAVVLGYSATVGYAMLTLTPHSRPPLFAQFHSTAAGFGPIAFLLCIHFLIFPIMNASGASKRAGGFERLVTFALLTAAVINGAFGALGLVYFGSGVSSIVLNDISSDSMFFVATKLLMCVDLICTYPLVFLGARQVLETSIGFGSESLVGKNAAVTETHGSKNSETVFSPLSLFSSVRSRQRVLRTCLVLVTVANATIGEFGGLVSLVGDIALTSLAFVLPPIMSLSTLWPEMSTFRRCANIAVLPVGIVVSAISTWETIVSLAHRL